jgi:methyl-accepting chemotaxis protein
MTIGGFSVDGLVPFVILLWATVMFWSHAREMRARILDLHDQVDRLRADVGHIDTHRFVSRKEGEDMVTEMRAMERRLRERIEGVSHASDGGPYR